MNIKSEKGVTGIDISIAIIILFIFISIIAVLSYNISSSSKEIELKADATYIAIQEIENLKNQSFSDLTNVTDEEISSSPGYYKTVIIQDYTEVTTDTEAIPDLVKKATVEIKYMFKGQEQRVELSSILTKE